jgi:hypothetical protein
MKLERDKQCYENLVWTLAIGVGLTFAAALTRYLLPSFPSRLQIAFFIFLTIFVECWIKPELKVKPKFLAALLTCACTLGAILLVRWQTEGLCPHTWPQCSEPIYAWRKAWGL